MSVISNTTLNNYVLANFGRQGIENDTSDSTVERALNEFIAETDISVSDGSWLALQDTNSGDMSRVTLVQIETAGLDDIIGKLDQLSSTVDTLSGLDSETEAWAESLKRYETLERELSQLIGLSTSNKTATLMINENDIAVSSQINFVDRLTTIGIDGDTAELAVIEVAKDDFLNGYHLADGCPICRAQMGIEASGGDGSDLAAATITDNSSNGSTAAFGVAASGTDYIDPLLSTRKWDLSDGESLSYSFYLGDAVVPYTGSYSPAYDENAVEIPDDQKDELREVYNLWSTFSNIDFEEVTETTGGDVGDLRNAYVNRFSGDDNDGTAAFAYYPNNSAIGGDTWYIEPNSVSTNATFGADTYGRMTALHEVGHSIGFKHPFDGSSGTNETLTGNGLTDEMRYSVMSYTRSDYKAYYESSGSLTSKNIYSNTPMVYDVAAVEYLYGAITDANLGDTTYTFGDTSHQRIQTLVDSGGTDTLDLSDARHRSIVDLTPGSLSSIGYATETEQEAYWASQGMSLAAVESTITPSQLFKGNDNVGIAFSATIENVIGSAGADEVTGNAAANTITGNAGDDVIDGGDGSDTAVFNGNFAEYTITDNGDGTHTVTDSVSGRDGTDTVSNVEIFQFADAGYSVSSGTSFGDANYRGGSNGGGTSNVYYSSFNRIDFGSRVMAPHEIAELKELLFNSVGDVSDLIEEALQSFVSQRASMSNVLGRLGSSLTQNSVNGPTDIAGVSDTAVEVAREEASALASELKQEILKNAAQAFQAQQPPSTNEVNSLLAIT